VRDLAVLAAVDPVLLALIPAAAGVSVALIAGIFGMFGRRNAEADQARRDLVDDMSKRIELLVSQRNDLQAQVVALEAKIREHEGRPTRRKL
jgi:hypothetical protein